MAIRTGFPDASTTGVPAGTTLTPYTGLMTITTDGTVIDGKISGTLIIKAANVVVQNCSISRFWGIDTSEATNTTVKDCTIMGPGYAHNADSAIVGSGTFLPSDISKFENGIRLQDGGSDVKYNCIHDLQAAGADPYYDGIAVQGGQHGLLIGGNTVIGRDSSDVFIRNDFGPISDVTVNHNLAGDPAHAIYFEGCAKAARSLESRLRTTTSRGASTATISVFTALTSTEILPRGAFNVGAAARDATDHIITIR